MRPGSFVLSSWIVAVIVTTLCIEDVRSTALADDPSQHEYFAKIAESHVQRQDYLKASQFYEKFIDEPDVKAEYYLRYGQVLKSLRLYAKAKFYFQKYAAFYPVQGKHFVESCDIARQEMKGKEFYEVDLARVASFGSEYGPMIVSKTLYFNAFQSVDATEEIGTNTIYESGSNGTKPISQTSEFGELPSTASHIRFSGNGSWAGYHTQQFAPGMRLYDERPGSIQLFVGKVGSKNDLSELEAFPFNSNDYASGYPSFSPDGSVLYFASNMPGGEGGWDIYVSFRSRDGWTKPQNLGPHVNTSGNEIAPYYHDQKLYFSSDWHTGLGGFDIFKATSTDGQWTNVRSMGYPLNSPKDDLDFFVDDDGETGFFASNRVGGPGEYDIYAFETRYDEVLVTVKDQDGEQPVSGAMIRYDDNGVTATKTDANGMAVLHHPYEGTREVTISHKDYRNLTMTLRAGKGRKPSKYEVFIDRSLAIDNTKQVAENAKSPRNPAKANSDFPSMMQPRNNNAEPARTDEAFAPEPVVKTKTIIVDDEVAPSPGVLAAPASSETPVTSGFAVQVAAVGTNASLTPYTGLKKYGDIMRHEENGMIKVRVGYFADRAEANRALSGIKTSGYRDAFIVSADMPTMQETAAPEKALAAPVPDRSIARSEDYFVRLGTYSRPEFFQENKVNDLGEVMRYKKGNLTIMLLTGFPSFEDAEKARRSAATRGFADAYVAVEKNGNFVKAR